MSKYPYPVLFNEDSSYNENITFEITYVKSVCIKGSVTLELNVSLNSETIIELINQGKAKMIIKVQTGFYSYAFDYVLGDETAKCEIEQDKIKSNDTINCTAYVVATEAIKLNYSSELLPLYDKDYSVTLKQNDVLAISNTESLSYSTCNNDFIKFSVSEDMRNKGYEIVYKVNYVNVIISPEFNVAYGKVKNNDKALCSVFDSHLIFEVLVYILIDLVQQYDEYKESQWYELFEQAFLQIGDYRKFEDFILKAKDDEIIDLKMIYELAHKMINNQIENTLISVSKMEED